MESFLTSKFELKLKVCLSRKSNLVSWMKYMNYYKFLDTVFNSQDKKKKTWYIWKTAKMHLNFRSHFPKDKM